MNFHCGEILKYPGGKIYTHVNKIETFPFKEAVPQSNSRNWHQIE